MVLTADRSPTGVVVDADVVVRLLDGFEVTRRSERLVFPDAAARLIAYLALQRRPLARPTVAGVLWPEATQQRAQASLRSTLWRVRRVHDGMVDADRNRLSLAADVVVDVDVLDEVADRIDGGDAAEADTWRPVTSVSLELLPDWTDDWVLFERERLRLVTLQALEVASDRHATSGDFAAAVTTALAAVQLEPLRESAHRALMHAHIKQGNVVEALRQFRFFRRLLLDELGVEPSRRMTALLRSAGVAVPARCVAPT